MERLYSEFGQRLRKVRADAGLTQKQVADRVGLKRTSITNIERGRQHIALHQLFLLASAVGCQPQDLLPDGAAALEDLVGPDVLKALPANEEERVFATRILQKRIAAQANPRKEPVRQ